MLIRVRSVCQLVLCSLSIGSQPGAIVTVAFRLTDRSIPLQVSGHPVALGQHQPRAACGCLGSREPLIKALRCPPTSVNFGTNSWVWSGLRTRCARKCRARLRSVMRQGFVS